MALRGKKPDERPPRLKLLMFGEAGVGKTMAAIQMPRPYIIDTEDGTGHYGDTIETMNGVVFQTTDMDEAVKEVKSLSTEDHEYRTLVIDPFTTLYDTALDEGELKVGTDFGRHYGYANKPAKRLNHLLSIIDMNIVVTCHSKNEYGDGMKIVGQTFDGWKKLDYLFDLVLQLQRRGKRRVAIVRKTRLPEFPDQHEFDWSYDNLVELYGRERMERKVDVITFADAGQVAEVRRLLEVVRVDADWLDKCLTKAKAEQIEDLTSDQASKIIETLTKKLEKAA